MPVGLWSPAFRLRDHQRVNPVKLPLVEITESLVDDAAALAEDEALRGDNALHVAAALTVEATVLTSADDDLCAAGLRRGLHVANPLGD